MTDLSASINAAGYAEIVLRTRSALQECAADDIMTLSVAPHMAHQEYRLREMFVVMSHVDDRHLRSTVWLCRITLPLLTQEQLDYV